MSSSYPNIYFRSIFIAGSLLLWVMVSGCSPKMQLSSIPKEKNPISGTEFYNTIMTKQWKERDSIASNLILKGNIPPFLRRLAPVKITIKDSLGHPALHATLFVAQDYLSIGNAADWARIPLTPQAAQKIADRFGCFLPTKKIVEAIYTSARVKLEPVPLYIYRDSSVSFWQHHLIIEGQRKGRQGLIAGIKKDVVISSKLLSSSQPNRVAIYGWHRLNGLPIQPLYTGHVNWYVDYSHGIRLIYRKMKVNGKWMDYSEVLADKKLQKLICDEEYCGVSRY